MGIVDNPHPPPIPRRLDQAQPSNVRRHLAVIRQRGLDLLKFVFDQRVARVSVGVVVREDFEGLFLSVVGSDGS